MSDIVLSMLRRRVLGLVIVVPRLALRACPRLYPPGDGIVGLVGVWIPPGPEIVEVVIRASPEGGPRSARSFSKPSLTPLGATGPGCGMLSEGVTGNEDDSIARPSSDSASNSSGGKRSFSISDLRLAAKAQFSKCIHGV